MVFLSMLLQKFNFELFRIRQLNMMKVYFVTYYMCKHLLSSFSVMYFLDQCFDNLLHLERRKHCISNQFVELGYRLKKLHSKWLYSIIVRLTETFLTCFGSPAAKIFQLSHLFLNLDVVFLQWSRIFLKLL